jgi:hypothetical protein
VSGVVLRYATVLRDAVPGRDCGIVAMELPCMHVKLGNKLEASTGR